METNDNDDGRRLLSQAQVEQTLMGLAARVDALGALLAVAAYQGGADPARWRETRDKLVSVSIQKRLERLEDLSPTAAASMDHRGAGPELDEELLQLLRWDDLRPGPDGTNG